MKGLITVAGTVVVTALNSTGKERLNLQQVMVVTPRTAVALGLSYENLWEALASRHALPAGCAILVKLSNDAAPVLPGDSPSALMSFDKVTLAPDKNAFVRT